MAAQRDASGKFIKGSGGSGGGGASAPVADAGESAKKALGPLDKVMSVFKKMGGVAKGMASGVFTADKSIKGIAAAGHMGAASIAGFGATIATLASAPIPSATAAMSGFARSIGSFVAGAGKGFNDAMGGIADKLEKLGPEAAAVAMAFRLVGASIQAATEVMGAATGVMGQLMGMAIQSAEGAALMKARFAALAGSAEGGKAVQEMLGKLSQTLPFASSQVREWGQSLMAAGFRGKALKTAVESVAAATATMGESGGAAAEKMLKTLGEGGAGADKMVKAIRDGGPKANRILADMGLNVADIGTKAQRSKMSADQIGQAIENALKAKGKSPLETMMGSFPVILMKAQEGFKSLFSGLEPAVKPFMKEVQKLFSVFNKGGSATKGLKPIIGGVLADAFKWATKVVIALQKIVARMSKPGPLKAFGTALKVIGAIAEFTVEMVLGFVLVCMDIVDAVSGAIDSINKFGDSALSAAYDFVEGLVTGIYGGIGRFVDAVSAMATQGLEAFQRIFKIASPSAVMDKMGGYGAEGAAQGVEGGQSRVEGAASKLGAGMAGASAKGATGGGGKGGGKGAGVTINGGLHLHASGGTTQEQADEMVAMFLERLALTQGA